VDADRDTVFPPANIGSFVKSMAARKPILTVCEFLPVSNEERVAEQIAFVSNLM
jgi:hypothetical protein